MKFALALLLALPLGAQYFPPLGTGGGGGGAPSGPAGGDLGGSYPNPTVVKVETGVCGSGLAFSSGACIVGPSIPTNNVIQNGDEIFLNSTTGNAAYAATPAAQSVTAYKAGQVFVVTTDFTCVTTATLNVSGLGTLSLVQKDGTTPCNGQVTATQPTWVFYDGSVFRIMPPGGAVASGATALGTGSISSVACATVTVAATGVLATDSISWTPNASIKAVTGYVPSTSGGLSIAAYPTSGNVNFDVCNWSASPITPGAVTLNWRVAR